jgi:hypothetical protein
MKISWDAFDQRLYIWTWEHKLLRFYDFNKVNTFSDKTGDTLPPDDIISSHAVHFQVECSLRCLQKSTCSGYNYRTKSNKYAVNCQLSNKAPEREAERNGEWTFYQDLETVSKKIKMYYPRADGAKRRARVLIPPGYLHPGKRKH